ncbi:MAG: hypothetical protein A2W11_02845 [Ignavibacteria bacterium RBG_16_35_7]|nr:MAG: hypothetical protein A2W11_02845 [Ignavibacteria bacterium RBG_16_35_7]
MKFSVITKTGQKLPPWYYGKVYENYDANTALWVWIGFHTFLKIARYIRQIWNMYRGRKTWFDKQYIQAFNDGVERGYKEALKQNNMSKDFVQRVKRQLGTYN